MRILVNILSRITGQRTVFPFYHAVADELPIHLKHLYEVRNPKLFEADLDFFIKTFNSIGINDLSQNGFYLTFDDGLREFKEVAWPIIKQYGIPVALFVNPSFVGNKELFFRFKASILIESLLNNEGIDFSKLNHKMDFKFNSKSELVNWINEVKYGNRSKLDDLAKLLGIDFNTYLNEQKPYLCLEELKELQSEGVLIGAHSMDHPLFNELNIDAQLKQICDSVNWVNENFSQGHSIFSFPFTDFDLKKELFKQMDTNSEFNLEYSFGTAGIKKERFSKHLQRIPMENNLKSAEQILLKQYLYYLAKAPLFRNTIRRK